MIDDVVSTGYYTDPRALYDMTPAEIIATTQALAKREKRDQRTEDVRQGTIVASIYNQHRRKKSDPVLTWKDVFGVKEEKKPQTVDQMKAICKDMAIMYGGKIIKKEVDKWQT